MRREERRRPLILLVAGLGLLTLLLSATGGSAEEEPLGPKQLVPTERDQPPRKDWIREDDEVTRIYPLDAGERSQLERQRAIVVEAAKELDRYVSGDASDVATLQLLLDRGVFREDERYSLEALGVVLGDALVDRHDYEWVAYIGERDRARALHHEATGAVVFPVTAISVRFGSGPPVDVQALFEALAPEEAPRVQGDGSE